MITILSCNLICFKQQAFWWRQTCLRNMLAYLSRRSFLQIGYEHEYFILSSFLHFQYATTTTICQIPREYSSRSKSTFTDIGILSKEIIFKTRNLWNTRHEIQTQAKLDQPSWENGQFRNTPSTINLEEEEIVDALGNDGNASMPEEVNRPNPWRKKMMRRNYIYFSGLND
jgi:hypothetical protein